MDIRNEMSYEEIINVDVVKDAELINMHDICYKFILDNNNTDEEKIKVIKKFLSYQRKWAFISAFKLIKKIGFSAAYKQLIGNNSTPNKLN